VSTSAPTRSRPKARKPSAAAEARRRAARRKATRRRLWLLAAVAVIGLVVAAIASPLANKAVQEISLPLRHEDIIRQQAADKGLDPALLAAVIYQESRFRDGQVSDAGAQGLMQLMPDTAEYIAGLSGGTAFEQGDLATAQVNISYGAYYLRYLKNKYRGSDALALAAYNAGEGKLDEWLASAANRGETFDPATHIPFPETAHYVENVLKLRKDYAAQYAGELGL
jgi:soluble lytic murein transglycosylase